MADPIKDIEEKGKALVNKLFGSAKSAGAKINSAPAKTEAEIKKQTGEADDSKGVDKGELGKPYAKSFDFYK